MMEGSRTAPENPGSTKPGLSFRRTTLASQVSPASESPSFDVPPKPAALSFRSIGVPILLLGASLVTTTANGARFMENFREGMPPVVRDSDLWPWPWLLEHPRLFVLGFAFSGALLTILLLHEFAHYAACRLHGVKATLPWVLPAPTLSGTVGAVISIRSRIPSRNALMDVGASGPLAGYVASAIAVWVGLLLSHPANPHDVDTIVRFGGEPLTLRLLGHWIHAARFNDLAPHPILVAGWIGLFITSLNLIPGGQLDGGHILYAVSPRVHKGISRVLPFLLIVAGVVFWVGWALWGIILLVPAMRHPTVAVEPPLNRKRQLLAGIVLLVAVLSFTTSPFSNNSLLDLIHGVAVAAAR